MESPYLSDILQRIPEVLSRMDRESFSLTHGAGDRLYWCWKFTDFPGARFQEILFPIAWLYTSESFDNPWRGSAVLKEWFEAGIGYWSRIQYPDGSFDEAYPFEHSLAATAFTLFYISEAYELMSGHISQPARDIFEDTARKAADWLLANDETHGVLSNHLAAAAASLANSGVLLNDQRYTDRCGYFLNRIYQHQSTEGWYEEYGGADIGYQTHGSFYLARIYQRLKEAPLLSSLQSANDFLRFFIHPDGSLGGEYASRNTMFFYPAAFEMLHSECSHARAICGFARDAVRGGHTVGLRQMDSCNLYPVLNNYIFAHENFNKATDPLSSDDLPFRENFEKDFPDAGLFVKSTSQYYAITGGKKGGVLRVWNKRSSELAYQSSGYVLWNERKPLSTQSQGASSYSVSEGTLNVSAPFVAINRKIFSPYLFMAFRGFTLTMGRIPRIARVVKNLLVKVLVNRKSSSPYVLRRSIQFFDDHIELRDTFDSAIKVQHLDKFSTIHMGSSRYIHEREEQIRGAGYPAARISLSDTGVIEEATIFTF